MSLPLPDPSDTRAGIGLLIAVALIFIAASVLDPASRPDTSQGEVPPNNVAELAGGGNGEMM